MINDQSLKVSFITILTGRWTPAFNLSMLQGEDIEALLLDDGIVGPQHGRNTGLASFLESVGRHCADTAAAHQKDICFPVRD